MHLSRYLEAFNATLTALYDVRQPETSADLHILVRDVTHIIATMDQQHHADKEPKRAASGTDRESL